MESFLDHYSLGFWTILPPLPQWFLWNCVGILASLVTFSMVFLFAFFPLPSRKWFSLANTGTLLLDKPTWWSDRYEERSWDEVLNFSKEGMKLGLENNSRWHKSYSTSSIRGRNHFRFCGCQLVINSASIWTFWQVLALATVFPRESTGGKWCSSPW